MAEIFQTSNNMKQMFRDGMRKYFRAQYSFGGQHIKDIVLMLMNIKEVNNLRDTLGQKEFEMTKKALRDYDTLFSYANLIQDTILKLQEKHDSEMMKTKIDHENRRLQEIAAKIPPVNYRIMRAFFLLVNNCDLRNVSVPKDDRFDKGRPSYLPSDGGGGGNF